MKPKRDFKHRPEREKPEFDQKTVDLARVTRVTGGGKRMSFRALIVIGDKKGRVGFGVAKGKDVALAMSKAMDQAKKSLITLNFKRTVPHPILHKFGAAKILLKPAPSGTGIKAGGPVRIMLDMSGLQDVVGKMVSTSKNKINYTTCTYEALKILNKSNERKNK
ncbi:MAG: 30S ribosomal protein S5 [Patescibacteria group bacterium]|nr:30S ribosomal protein S5 [Patescibacteria group bacterium]